CDLAPPLLPTRRSSDLDQVCGGVAVGRPCLVESRMGGGRAVLPAEWSRVVASGGHRVGFPPLWSIDRCRPRSSTSWICRSVLARSEEHTSELQSRENLV